MSHRVMFLMSVGLFTASGMADDQHPFSVQDMLECERISSAIPAPDGVDVVFVKRSTDMEANKGVTDLWLVEVASGALRRLTAHPAGDWDPRWSPNGQYIYFMSTRSGGSQVWRIARNGGEAEQVTHQPLDIGTFQVAPDGRSLAVTMEVFVGTTAEDTAERLDQRSHNKSTGMVFDHGFVRHWDTWKDGRRSHVLVVPVEGGAARDIMKNLDGDVPSKPFGGAEDFTFTPDGKSIVFAARVAGRTEPWSTNFDLYIANIEGTAEPRNLTEDNLAWDAQPVFAPDGKTLAYLAMDRAGYEADRFKIKLMAWPAGQTRVLAESWDRSSRGVTWSPDGRRIFTTAANLGQSSLFGIDVDTGAVETIVQDGTVSGTTIAGQQLIYSLDHLRSPVELWTMELAGGQPRQLTDLNKNVLSSARMGEAEQFTFDGWNGETVHGYVVKPADFVAGKAYPVAFLIHGGPQGSFGNHWHYRWNPQAYAGRGYAAVFIDFHGSTGYGQTFTDSIRGDWGGKPLEDLQKGLTAALTKYPWLDGERVGALGASYGGYMINWIAGNWPERFRCLVNHDGVFNTRQMYFETEELWFPEWEFNGPPWANADVHRRNNPIEFVAKWKTPMLIIHGAHDYRVVDTQGLAAFNACQRRGIPSKLLYFPDENHWVLKPHNSIQWHETVLSWLDQWTTK